MKPTGHDCAPPLSKGTRSFFERGARFRARCARVPRKRLCEFLARSALVLLLVWGTWQILKPGHVHGRRRALHVSLQPPSLPADGWSQGLLTIEKPVERREESLLPKIEFVENAHAATVENIETAPSHWTAILRAGVMPGKCKLRVSVPDSAPVLASFYLNAADSDDCADGTPAFLRLEDERDRAAFRRWFTFLVEEQFFIPLASRPVEINDCAALVRYAYREALKQHSEAWAASSNLYLVPALDSVAKYNFPYTPLGPALFRLKPGPFVPSDLNSGTFGQFADAETIQRFNTYRVSRDVTRAEPGDLLFFRKETEPPTHHTMVVIGAGQISSKPGVRYVVYHTGPSGASQVEMKRLSGAIKRLSMDQLMRYPDPQWRPLDSNPAFLGVFRWNILRQAL